MVFINLKFMKTAQRPHSHILLAKGFFGSEVLAKRDFFGSMKDTGIFLGHEKNTGIFLVLYF